MVGAIRARSANIKPGTREIDAVYLWVDDQDPAWQAKRALHKPSGETAVSIAPARFRQFGELPTSLELLATNAPFIKRVFIVVDNQKPNLERLGQLPFEVVLINHSEFIPAKYLPTFNSRAITAHLHLIPGLSERFLYFNDDVFIARPSQITDWFDGQKPVLRFTETRFPERSNLKTKEVLYQARWKTHDLAVSKKWQVTDRMPEHAPYPLTKSIMTNIWTLFKKELEVTSASRFRSSEAILPELLAFYFAIGNEQFASPKGSTYKYVAMNERSALAPLLDLALKPNGFLTVCLNDVSEVSKSNAMSQLALRARYRRVLGFMRAAAKRNRGAK